MICPHVITEHAEDAAPYCQICAPQYIAALRARIEVLEKVAEVAANSFHWDGCDCGACSHFWSVYRKAKEG